MAKEYLGDAVHVEYVDHLIQLTTEDGKTVTNTIFLERDVFIALKDHVERETSWLDL